MENISKEKIDKIKEMLNDYLIKKFEIKDKELENQMLKVEDGLRAMEYKEGTGKTYKINSSVEDFVIKKENDILKNNLIIQKNKIHIEKIDNAINFIKSQFCKDVIVNKFLLRTDASWKDVAINLNSSAEVCRKASNKAIKEMARVLSIK